MKRCVHSTSVKPSFSVALSVGGTGFVPPAVAANTYVFLLLLSCQSVTQLILPSVDVGPISIDKALRLLGPHGWAPTPMTEWLAETVAWNMSKENRHYTKHVDDD